MAERPYEIVVFGATGVTGAFAAEHLADHAPAGTRWAIAGRSARKLDEIVSRLAGRACPPSGAIAADVADDESVRKMAAQTKVLATTVGPFDEYGEPVVRACVEEGTDYVDMTGEPQFVDRMILRYDDRARERGLKIVPCCGIDSIPHDLGVLFTLGLLPKDVPVTIEGFVTSKGTLSGGTWHSAVGAASKLRESRRTAAELKKRARPTDSRRVRGMPNRVRYVSEIGGWACPLPTIDPQIVRRSARMMPEYGPDFRYGHYARVRRLTTIAGAALAIGGVFALAQLPPTRALLYKWKQPGQGPTAEQRAGAYVRVRFIARAGDERVMSEVRCGEPYYESGRMIAEAALCLAKERERTPEHVGVITPAAAMGRPLIDRLVGIGIAFERVRG
jgi:short subunit dehydrogenase-like uncharacterized protein